MTMTDTLTWGMIVLIVCATELIVAAIIADVKTHRQWIICDKCNGRGRVPK